jgi:hypothetical protein
MWYDVFVYDVETEKLALVMLGVQLSSAEALKAPINSLPTPVPQAAVSLPIVATAVNTVAAAPKATTEQENQVRPAGKNAKACIFEDICGLLKILADIPADKIPSDASFDDLGIDSLMVSSFVFILFSSP